MNVLRVCFFVGISLIPCITFLNHEGVSSQSAHYYCDGLAREYADRNARGGTLRGAGRGAATGAIFGAIGGNAGKGAAFGAAGGALGGTIRRSETWQSLYQREYDNCMRRTR